MLSRKRTIGADGRKFDDAKAKEPHRHMIQKLKQDHSPDKVASEGSDR